MLRILHTNDFHGSLDDSRFGSLSRLRSRVDLYFDSGDAIKSGNLSVPIHRDPVWPRLANLNCTASVIGNRESHILETAFLSKLSGATHPILCGNLKRKDGSAPLPSSLSLEMAGLRIGVFGVMVPMVTERMVAKAASQFLWSDPILVARQVAEELRHQVDLLIALTHIGFAKDKELAAMVPSIDLILGGHSHTVLDEPAMVGRTAIGQTGSHGRNAAVMMWQAGRLSDYKLEPL